MLLHHGFVSNVGRRSCGVAGSVLMMSAGTIQGADSHLGNVTTLKGSASWVKAPPSLERAWMSSERISFAPPQNETWRPPREVPLARSKSAPVAHDRDGARKLSTSAKSMTPFLVTQSMLDICGQPTLMPADSTKPFICAKESKSKVPGDLSDLGGSSALSGTHCAQTDATEKAHSLPQTEKRCVGQEIEYFDAFSITGAEAANTLCPSASGLLNLQPSRRVDYPCLQFTEISAETEQFIPIHGLSPAKFSSENPNSEKAGQSSDGNIPLSIPPSEDGQSCSPLGFHISKSKLQEARNAKPSSPAAYWQYTLYQGPGGDRDRVKVHYCKSKEVTERIAQYFLDKDVLGFDIEWKAQASATEGIKKNVALIQIASEERIALFHIARFRNGDAVDDFVAPALKQIMESTSITKVGVSIKADCSRLRKFLNINSLGLFELSHLYKLVKYSSGDVKKINKTLVNLAQQVQEHLQLPLWKGDVRSSDWSEDLDYEQIQYAASDSYAGFQLYHMLEAKRKALDPTPPRPAHVELNIPVRIANVQTVATFDEYPEPAEEVRAHVSCDPDISVQELAHNVLNVKIEYPPLLEPVPLSTKSTAKSSLPSPSVPTPASSSEVPSTAPIFQKPFAPKVVEANAWAQNYVNNPPTDRPLVAKFTNLRTYALWEVQGLEPDHITSLLRDPPLQKSTVAGYILHAIWVQNLPFNRKRAFELLPLAHVYVRPKYKAMLIQKLRESALNAKVEKEKGQEGPDDNR